MNEAMAEAYESGLGRSLFEPFAHDIVRRLPSDARSILEVAAGTGVVTRVLLDRFGSDARLVITDINPAMLEVARATIDDPRVEWQTADALRVLPFEDASFDVLVCQFAVMFYPDRAQATREAKRVLKPGGTLLINSWASREQNAFGRITIDTLARLFPADPPRFLSALFNFSDPAAFEALLADAGFEDVRIELVRRVIE